MDKGYIFRKASVVHLVKCGKTADFLAATISFDFLTSLKKDIETAKGDDLSEINKKIDNWAGTNPIATDREIDDFMNPNKQK